MNIQKILAKELSLREDQVQNALALIDEGKTVPFIARYRKEATGEMSDETLRAFEERLKYLRRLQTRAEQVRESIQEQGKLTQALQRSLESAVTLQEVEDLYAPFKQKRRTRASLAREKGLGGLAAVVLAGEQDPRQWAAQNLTAQQQEDGMEEALRGAQDIIAEQMAEDFQVKKQLRLLLEKEGALRSQPKRGAQEKPDFEKFAMYHDFSEKIRTILPHRVLALNRGEALGILSISLQVDAARAQAIVRQHYLKNERHRALLETAWKDSLQRLLLPALEREQRTRLTEWAQERAISVFAKNLSSLLLQSPLPGKTVLGWDPGFRTGCKLAVVDPSGEVLYTGAVYPTAPHFQVEDTERQLQELIERYGIAVIAIGNGTASRESETIIAGLLRKLSSPVRYVIISEAGASIYSASERASEEFPDLDVTVRAAVSIARRLQDPLSELVKIDPIHIGVGQYQHDLPQKRMQEVLGNVVEDCVNRVGVDLNLASAAVLEHVAGITKTTAANIVRFRQAQGGFVSRKDLRQVPRLGPAVFEQCAGFLRLKDSPELLDRTGVHPESYAGTYRLLKAASLAPLDLIENPSKAAARIEALDFSALSQEVGLGEPTLRDIIKELEKPGRDIRQESGLTVLLREDILDIKDLQIGIKLSGTVRNVVDFGAFVDIGLKQDGLVHISELSDRYIKSASEVVSVGDIVEVSVIGIDALRAKVSLSMRKEPLD